MVSEDWVSVSESVSVSVSMDGVGVTPVWMIRVRSNHLIVGQSINMYSTY